MRSIVAVSIRIGLSFFAASAMAGVVWIGLLALTWMAGADWVSTLVTPAYSVHFQLSESQGASSSLASLVTSIESRDLEVSRDDGSDPLALVVHGAEDIAPVTELIDSHGYRVRSATTSYDMWAVGENAIRSTGSFGLLMVSQFVGFGFVGWHQWRRFTRSQAATLMQALQYGLGLGAAAVMVGTLVEIVAKSLGAPVTEQAWVEGALKTGGASTVLFVVLIVIAGPIAEELFFRGFLFQLLKERTTPLIAYVVSSGVFASVHFNPSAIVLYLLYGAAFAYAFQQTGRLVTAVVAHSVINAVAVIIVLI